MQPEDLAAPSGLGSVLYLRYHCVASVWPPVEADYQARAALCRKGVNDLSLAFVAPPAADYRRHSHDGGEVYVLAALACVVAVARV